MKQGVTLITYYECRIISIEVMIFFLFLSQPSLEENFLVFLVHNP